MGLPRCTLGSSNPDQNCSIVKNWRWRFRKCQKAALIRNKTLDDARLRNHL